MQKYSQKWALIQLIIGVVLILVGSITTILGLVIALIVNESWLRLSLVGVIAGIAGILLIYISIKKSLSKNMRRNLPKFVKNTINDK